MSMPLPSASRAGSAAAGAPAAARVRRHRRSRGPTTIAAIALAAPLLLTSCLRVTLEELKPEEIETTLFLIGDAGEPDPRAVGTPLDSLTTQAAVAPEKSIIVFMGDNVYPAGIPEVGRAEYADALRRLDAQIQAVPPRVQAIFIPGNHDWALAGPYGLYSVRLQDKLIASLRGTHDVKMLPGNGCPGPAMVDAGRLRLVVMDTQWWLHDFIVRDTASHCATNEGAVTGALREAVRPPGEDRIVVFAAHHPLMTGGEHGGYCGITGPIHRFGNRNQDIISTINRTMRDSIESAFGDRPPLVAAAGHEHNLQVLKGRAAEYILVSGAGSYAKAACAVRLRESYFVTQRRSGFMRLDIMKGKGVLLRVFKYSSRGIGGLAYSRWLEPRS
jgi:hypothetical protein